MSGLFEQPLPCRISVISLCRRLGKLANGINPIDGSMIPDEDAVNNVRLSRCFFYAADVLRQVINNGGVTPQRKTVKTAFALTAKQRNAFEFSASPIPISELSKRINSLSGDENMATLGYSTIRDWLISLGMLEEVLDGNGQKVKRPTAQGESIGIILDARTGNNGTFFVVIYDLAAQHFIMDHLDAIIEFDRTMNEKQGQPRSQSMTAIFWICTKKACPSVRSQSR